jgi:hypothetical protein
METLNSRDRVDLWESWDDHGKLHIGHNACLNWFTFFLSMGFRDQRSASLSHWRLHSFCTKNGHSLAQL